MTNAVIVLAIPSDSLEDVLKNVTNGTSQQKRMEYFNLVLYCVTSIICCIRLVGRLVGNIAFMITTGFFYWFRNC
ncbi:hypothetical protein V1517DRAFT_333931 [Lipomyces orientalis]|uniref:Uncharacterized protein n=1 Tax=Lipomyces orientalis TaxID=1233043 RepID=A0ACC3TCV0_9ASCO